LFDENDVASAEDAGGPATLAGFVFRMTPGWVVRVAHIETTVLHLEDVDIEGQGRERSEATLRCRYVFGYAYAPPWKKKDCDLQGRLLESRKPFDSIASLSRSGHSPRRAAIDSLVACHERGVRQHGESNGSPGMAQTRTSFTLEMTVGIPLLRWGEGPFVSHPVPYPSNCLDAAKALVPDIDTPRSPLGHPIHMALKWRQMLDEDPGLSMAQIARNQNVSRARVTQIMNLLSLPQGIQECLTAVRNPAEIAFLTEHKLRAVTACASAELQMRQFLEIQNAFRMSSAV
jgi:hypothetical protein